MPEPRENRVDELAAALEANSEPEPEADQPEEATPDIEAGQPQAQGDEFFDLDLTSVPEDADREWLAKRHKEMQAAFTKKTTSLAEQRREAEKITAAFNDPDQLAHLLRERGFDLDDDSDDEFEYEDEGQPEYRDPRVDQLIQERYYEQEAAAQEHEFRSAVDELETREGRQVDDDEWDLLWTLTTAGVPVDAGYQRISEISAKARKSLVKSKKDAPQAPQAGKSATQVPDLSDERTRVEHMAELIERGQS